MSTLFQILVFLFLAMFFTWGMYLAVMNLIQSKHKLTLAAKFFAYPLAAIGIIMDFLINIIVGTLLFLDLPREFLLTARLQRYLDDLDNLTEPAKGLRNWRHSAALWICTNLLDPFDSRGYHCKKPKQ